MRRGLIALGVVLLAGCTGQGAQTPSGTNNAGGMDSATVSPPTAATSQPGGEGVTRLPSHVTSAVGSPRGLPASFPLDLDRLAEFEASPEVRAWLAYRPREVLRDGSGWSTETIALWNGSWTRLSLGRLGIPERLWPGGDMLGSGALDDTGTQLAFDASSGVIVVDLTSGRWESYLEGVGGVGSIRWYPGGSRFVADPWKGRDKVVDVRTGEVTDSVAPALGLGFRGNEDVVTVTRSGDVDRLRNLHWSKVTDLPASPRQRGRYFQSWWSGDRVAYSNWETVGGRYALRVADEATGQPVATLTWSRETGTWLKIHGWWDEQRILLSMDRSLITWAPETGEVDRVAELPRSNVRKEHGGIGISFQEPRPQPDA